MAINKQKALDAAQRFLQKGQIDKAIAEYRKVCEADPDDLRSLQKLGDLYARQGHRQEAIATYMKLAEMLTARGFANRAVSIYKQILQLNPLLVPVYVKLSDLFKELGLSKDARIFNQRAVEILQKTGNQDDLLQLLRRIVEGDPEDAISRITLAETYLRVDATSEAVAELEAALPLLREQKLDDLFIRAAERLLYHYPDNIELCRELAVLHLRRNEIPRAMKLLLFCRKKDPEDVKTMELLAGHFAAAGETNKASVVLAEKAKVHRKQGETDLLRRTYQRMVEIDPSDSQARRALAELGPEPEAAPAEAPAEAPAAEDEAEIPIFEDSIVGARRPSSSAPAPAPEAPARPAPEAPARPAPEAPARPAPEGSAPSERPPASGEADKYLEEAGIYMKYGLVDKALEHLAEGVEKTGGDPSLIERIKDIHLDNGEMEQAVEHLLVLAQRLAPLEPERARIALKEVLLVDPDEGRAREMLESLAGAPAEVEEPGEEVEEPEEEVEELEEVEEVEELEEIPEAEEIAPVEPMALDAPIQEAEYSSFLDEETSDPGAHLPAVEQAAEQEVPEVRTDGADADLAALERETSEPGAPVPPPEQWDEEREERPSGPGGEEEMARALESVTLPDLELEEFDALDRETEEIEGPTVPDVFAEEPAEAPPEPPAAPPPPPEAPVSSTTSVAVEEALEEADFFISQGLKQEAALFLQDLLSSYPGNRLIEDKLAELSEGTPQDKPETDLFTGEPEPLLPPDPSEETELESASQITDEAFDALSAIESIIQEDGDGTEALGAQPTEIEASDARTHFDLGIAYMEMGVTESAIQEFRIASNAPEMEAVSYNMIGNCLMSAGRVEDAIKEYKLGLFAKDKTQDQELNLYYDIAEAYLKLEDQKEALYYLQNIKKKDPGFKDVKLKLVALSSSFKPSARASGAPAEEPKPAPAKDPGEAAREVDDAFDDLFGEFSGKDE